MVLLLLSGVAETVKLPELLALKVTLPVPVIPVTAFDIVNKAVPVEVKVLLPEAAVVVMAPETVKADVLLACVIVVTLPSTAELIVTKPEPAPTLVTAPTLLTAAVVTPTVPLPVLALIVKLLVPVTPPENTTLTLPVLPMVSVPVVLEAKIIGRAMVSAAPNNSVALSLPPALLPNVTVPGLAPKQAALTVPTTVPFRTVKPLVKVLVAARFS